MMPTKDTSRRRRRKQARRIAEEQQRKEAEEQQRKEAEEQQRKEAEEQQRKEAEEKQRKEVERTRKLDAERAIQVATEHSEKLRIAQMLKKADEQLRKLAKTRSSLARFRSPAPDSAEQRAQEAFRDVATSTDGVESQDSLPYANAWWTSRSSASRRARLTSELDEPQLREHDSVDRISLEPGSPFFLSCVRKTLLNYERVDDWLKNVHHEHLKLVRWQHPFRTALVLMVALCAVWVGWLFQLLLAPATLYLIGWPLRYGRDNLGQRALRPDHEQRHLWATSPIWFSLLSGAFIDCTPMCSAQTEPREPINCPGCQSRIIYCNKILELDQRVRETFRRITTVFDKAKSLLSWKNAKSTLCLLLAHLALIALACFMGQEVALKVTGTILLLKLFVVNEVFRRFPRLAIKCDLIGRAWEQLPVPAAEDTG